MSNVVMTIDRDGEIGADFSISVYFDAEQGQIRLQFEDATKGMWLTADEARSLAAMILRYVKDPA